MPPKGPNQQAAPGKPPGPANPVKAPGKQPSGQQPSGQQSSGPKPGPGGSGPNGPGQQNVAQKPQNPQNPGQNPHNPAQPAARGNESRPPAPAAGRPPQPNQGERPGAGAGGPRAAGYAGAAEQPSSMRPRNEPEAEPGDLFRPSADQASQSNRVGEPATTAVPQTSASAGKGERTTLVPTIQPSISGKAGGDAARPVAVDATTTVSPGLPQQIGHGPDGAAAPVPAGARPDKRDAGRDSQDKPRAERDNNGSTGTERADRPASASRSG